MHLEQEIEQLKNAVYILAQLIQSKIDSPLSVRDVQHIKDILEGAKQ